jgi:hypothetical protein
MKKAELLYIAVDRTRLEATVLLQNQVSTFSTFSQPTEETQNVNKNGFYRPKWRTAAASF